MLTYCLRNPLRTWVNENAFSKKREESSQDSEVISESLLPATGNTFTSDYPNALTKSICFCFSFLIFICTWSHAVESNKTFLNLEERLRHYHSDE